MSTKRNNLKEVHDAPQVDTLHVKHGIASAIILDAEGDEIPCTFNNDMCVEINTEELSYITLTVENLERMIELIEEAERYYYHEKE